MKVSRSGFYKFLRESNKNRVDPDTKLVLQVKGIFEKSRRTYGSRRIAKSLTLESGKYFTRYRARKLMYKAGVEVKKKKNTKIQQIVSINFLLLKML